MHPWTIPGCPQLLGHPRIQYASMDDPWMSTVTWASTDTLAGGVEQHPSMDDTWMSTVTWASTDTLAGGVEHYHPWTIHECPQLLGHPRILWQGR